MHVCVRPLEASPSSGCHGCKHSRWREHVGNTRMSQVASAQTHDALSGTGKPPSHLLPRFSTDMGGEHSRPLASTYQSAALLAFQMRFNVLHLCCTSPLQPLEVSANTSIPAASAEPTHPVCSQSIVRVVFHERRLQYMEHQQLEGWKWNRPGDRILDIGQLTCPSSLMKEVPTDTDRSHLTCFIR